ncbi:MAG: TRAP transporter large permease subunit [Myxococcales bacterium]|nr:TRAP transporter large permease subunit [Myxococcales bacterium]MCB9524060.1 TRAP transporter large permease subunit [Myxococcales bacterium]
MERARRALHRVENALLIAVFFGAIGLPLLVAASRIAKFHVPHAHALLSQLLLWLTFLGGLVATRERKHLQLSANEVVKPGPVRTAMRAATAGLSATITALLGYAAWQVAMASKAQGGVLPFGLPSWISELVMPVTLGLMAARLVWQAGEGWRPRLVALALLPVGFLLDLGPLPELVEGHTWGLALAVLVGAVLGAPVFVAMAGLGMLFYFADNTPIAAVSGEIYRLITQPTLPAVPLLTVTGYVLAESKASERLVRFFRALFGWMPGGVAVLVTAVCAVFTTFTGGSGVTIIALGGLVYGILRDDKYPEGFSLGLVTASGSLGLLFPPSLPVILYAVVVSASPEFTVPAEDLYLAGVLPGLLMVLLVAGYGVWRGRRYEGPRQAFDVGEVLRATWAAKWELSVPLVVVGVFAAGLASMVEAAALAAAYALILSTVITRDIHPVRELPQVMVHAGVLVGAVLVLLASAMGLSSYVLVEAAVPDLLLEWAASHIESKWAFLLALNGLLLLLGAVLEIYSAIVIIPPILAPLALHYGVDPVHLGIIFLANLELGFLTPPVGLNLFLSASRFEVPMVRLYREMVPYLLILGVGVLLITYVPALSVGVRDALKPPVEAPAAAP